MLLRDNPAFSASPLILMPRSALHFLMFSPISSGDSMPFFAGGDSARISLNVKPTHSAYLYSVDTFG